MLQRRRCEPRDPRETADLMHPLYCKMSLLMQEPLLAKGSVAARIPKSDGDAKDIASSRSILLSGPVTTHHHAFIRSRLKALYITGYKASQCGGVPCKGVDEDGVEADKARDQITARMAAPISAVLTLVSPAAPVKRSPVRRPESMTAWTAASMASAAVASPSE